MKTVRVRDLMVPLTEYATVGTEATLFDAVMALEGSKDLFKVSRAPHRAVLVLDEGGEVVGKIGFLDLLQGLEPTYTEVEELKHMGSAFTPTFIRSLLEKYPLWKQPLDDICRKATRIRVKDVMYTPRPTEIISEEATLNEAVHQLVVDRRQSLLVTMGNRVVGILRLSDVVEEICARIKACGLPA